MSSWRLDPAHAPSRSDSSRAAWASRTFEARMRTRTRQMYRYDRSPYRPSVTAAAMPSRTCFSAVSSFQAAKKPLVQTTSLAVGSSAERVDQPFDVAQRLLGLALRPVPLDRQTVVQRRELNVHAVDRGRLGDRHPGHPQCFVAVTLHAVKKAQDLQDLGADLTALRRKPNRFLGEGAKPGIVVDQPEPAHQHLGLLLRDRCQRRPLVQRRLCRHDIAGGDVGVHRAEPAAQTGGGIRLGRGGQSGSLQQLASQLLSSTAPGDVGCPLQFAGNRLVGGRDRPRAMAGTLHRVVEHLGENAVRATTFGRGRRRRRWPRPAAGG